MQRCWLRRARGSVRAADAAHEAPSRSDRLGGKAAAAGLLAATQVEHRNRTRQARRLFHRRGWPVIDVTHLSIEQAASQIIELLAARSGESG